jgi:para-nitrobenzyl esterase
MGVPRAAAAAGPIVQTASGPVQGFLNNNIAEFLGIPYAAPPVGKLRWNPPQPPAPWKKTLMATSYGPRCAQITTLGVFAGPATNNEDCLFVNVFTPDLQNNANLPVIVWIHGGGNLDGESNDYDGRKLALQGNTVVVTINYRLNLMGFLAVPSLDTEGHNFGNYGLLDQQLALTWVHQNIAGFGGDPTNVTLGGQSAGAEDTGLNMLSPLASGLFQRGICESFCPASNLPTLAAAEAIGDEFATAAGCGSKTGAAQAMCLRALPASEVEALAGTASAASKYVVGAMLDGTVIPVQPPTAWANGQFTHMPLINGNVADEEDFGLAITEYFSKPRQPPTGPQYMSYVANTYASPPYPAGTANKVLALYPLSSYPTPQIAWDRAGTDPGICAQMALNMVLAPQIPVYAYNFDDQTPPFYFPRMPGFVPLAYHTSDIQFLFPMYHGGQGTPHLLNAQQDKLSNELVSAWTKFAWTGNPDGVGNTPWPVYSAAPNQSNILLENIPTLSTETNNQFSAAHHCNFWDSIAQY